ncbi:hypothetical protein RHMOL_Rhmol09G0158400 [Rhododendron molle]|uniref:Uncharacterized protein n=1 Tax=Rhododendron molle TaxID=49168 RepID=A0ACC0MFQ9_RHOML|nr:hypothetical protein RHMOL_Rhmol09G0158400 [Rhododendron molle]
MRGVAVEYFEKGNVNGGRLELTASGTSSRRSPCYERRDFGRGLQNRGPQGKLTDIFSQKTIGPYLGYTFYKL